MAKIETILFATDFSKGSAQACELARTLGTLTGARLHVLHVITTLHDRSNLRISSAMLSNMFDEIKQGAAQDMRQFCQENLAGLDITPHIVQGASHEELLREATRIGADLIIMGTHGRTGLEKLLMGSTAEKVVRSSIIPVLTVRESETAGS
ncbi:universal stress protein [Thauera linaloolentis]|uniref:Universal stress protein n=1 Tax=Thauera linaloolentis (strain DSM 12138 / JCM 21573 / CCUG 41526 / CIP 105981 / IAM 15112 / NBRC 102519 / 47Lol) TaxID=1123367 RepID=N6YWG8_THAL4|nr:universal stress protein [Thauera linaloolentis]ENO86468.1 UspA domain-containing protein [Thauera linaloolentis 47Lol = DSM 12138]MCM8567347.1 universal stress protein [Thauera linaloolentis]